MQTVGDFILSLKVRLRETKDASFEDESLKEFLNIALYTISRDLLLFKDAAFYIAKADQRFFPLPSNKLRTIAVSIDDEPAVYKSFDYIVTNKKALDSSVVYVYETQDGLYTSKPLKEGTRVDVAYNSTRRVDSMDEVLPVPDFAIETLTLYCLYLANQRKNSEDSIRKATAFFSMYEEEAAKLKAIINKNYFSKNITTNYQVV